MKKKGGIIFLVFLIMSVTISFSIYIKKGNILKGTTADKLFEISNEIIERSLLEGYDDIEKLTDDEKEVLMKSSSREVLANLYFIEGFFYKLDLNFEEAERNYNKALTNLEDSNNKKLKARIYYEESNIYLENGEEEKSRESFQNVKEIYKEEEDKEYLLWLSLNRSNDLFRYESGNEECILLLNEVLDIAKEINYEYIVDIYYSLGLAYWYDDERIQAINYKLEALNIADERKNIDDLINMTIDIGVDFLEVGDYEQAIKYIKESIDNYNISSNNEDSIKTYAWLNLYEAYSKDGRYEEAKEALKNAEIYIDNQENDNKKYSDIILLEYNRADLLMKLGKADEAQEILNKCSEKYYNNVNGFWYLNFDIKLEELQGNIYYKLEKYNKALESHLEVKRMADERGLKYLMEAYNEYIYMDYKALGDYENAFNYAEANNIIKDESNKNNSNQYSKFLISKFSNDKKEIRILSLEERQKKIRRIFIFSALITVFSIIFTIAIFRKNREIKRLNKLFKSISVTDGLTNIPNRRALDEYLLTNWNTYKETKIPISFIMIDIDYFKRYNDNYGHPKGDEVLIKVSNCIKSSCRKSDFVARYGGEEFIIIMLNTGKEEAKIVASRILKNIEELNIRHEYSDISDRVTISMGISSAYYNENNKCDEYISLADSALYEAKKRRNSFVYKDFKVVE